MDETKLTSATQADPATIETLARDFKALGIVPGMTLLLHSSLRALGWVCGGPVAVIQALEHVLTERGTLVMPTFSGDLSDPAQWRNPPVPESWWETIRRTLPAYAPDLTPTRNMGIIPETFRKGRGVLRSAHPQTSFAARGRHARTIVAQHGLAGRLGERSPLARIYNLDGWVLLLGVGHGNNTSLHLAEYRATFPSKRYARDGAPLLVNGKREWVWFNDLDLNDDDFPLIGASATAETDWQREGRVARARALLMPQRPLVDYAVGWLERHRR